MHNWQIANDFNFLPGDKKSLEKLTLALLENRGIKGPKNIDKFLNGTLEDITLKSLNIDKKEVEKASERIKKAVEGKEKIVVYTDYDADGILSGAIIWETIHKMKGQIMPFVPDRFAHGYGLSKKGLDKVKKDFAPSLLITVDHGITAAEEVEYARSLGMDSVIIDHHLKPEILPASVAIVHTTALSATGLSWVFANYLTGKIREELLDLVALATVADLMPLLGENRILVKKGLEQINKTRRVGLLALIKKAGLEKGNIDAYALSHVISPRLNASGRLTSAMESLRLICTTDPQRADRLADMLNEINKKRQDMTRDSAFHAEDGVDVSGPIIIVSHESYHQGVIGLIAGKLAEKYRLPAVVISETAEFCKASVRSVKGVNIVEILHLAGDLLIDVGGHPMAAGFTVSKKNIPRLKEKLLALASEKIAGRINSGEITVDCLLDPAFIDDVLFEEVEKLSPFGAANPQPVFAAVNLKVISARLVGRDSRHLKLHLASPSNPEKLISAIGFNMPGIYSSLDRDTPVDIAYRIAREVYNGRTSLILKLADVKLTAIARA